MHALLVAVLLYVTVFGADYLFYVKQKSHYRYVSRRTYLLFVSGQIAIVWYFYSLFEPYISNILTELALLFVVTALVLGFVAVLVKDHLLVCNISSRSERCLTPGYVLVKGAEIVLQQLVYFVIALSLTSLLGATFGAYIAYIVILLSIHTVLILGCDKSVAKHLAFGVFVLSVPVFYIYTELQAFWPAVYLHSILYIFYWITFADFDGLPEENATFVENSG